MSNIVHPSVNISELKDYYGYSNWTIGLLIFIFLGLLAFVILNYVGLGYITSVVFDKSEWKDLTETQKNLTRMFVVVSWISLVIVIFSGISKL